MCYCVYLVPPRPQSVSLSMECSVSNGRSVNISWMVSLMVTCSCGGNVIVCTYINIQDVERPVGVVYPGEKAMVVLTPREDIDCTVDGTRCTASITKDDNYTFNLTLSNDIGSSEAVIDSFNCKPI